MKNDKISKVKQLVIDEFSGENTRNLFITQTIKEGLWDSEKYFISKYFKNKNGRVLDLGCGTGRTTIPLFKEGYNVIGIDLAPKMIEAAKKMAEEIDYRIGDATKLDFEDNSFDYALFSAVGWTQIPGKKERLKALKEVYRVLKNGGVYIFTANNGTWFNRYFFQRIWQWIRFYILKPLGFKVDEINFGDVFFTRKATGTRQYIHVPTIKEVKSQIKEASFKIVEINGKLQKPNKKSPKVVYVCKK